MSRIHEALKKAEHERSVSAPQPLPVEATPGFEGLDRESPVETVSSAYAAAMGAVIASALSSVHATETAATSCPLGYPPVSRNVTVAVVEPATGTPSFVAG